MWGPLKPASWRAKTRQALGAKTATGVHRTAEEAHVHLQGCPVLQVSQSGGAGDIWASQGDRSASKALEAWTWASS